MKCWNWHISICIVNAIIFIKKHLTNFFRVSLLSCWSAPLFLSLLFCKAYKFICNMWCVKCDAWCDVLDLTFCKVLTGWVKRRPKIPQLGNFKPFKWYSKTGTKWQFYVHYTLQGLRLGRFQLVDWCICWPTRGALKMRNNFRLIFLKQKNAGASFRIGWEIRCLPYAGFFLTIFFSKKEIFEENYILGSWTWLQGACSVSQSVQKIFIGLLCSFRHFLTWFGPFWKYLEKLKKKLRVKI